MTDEEIDHARAKEAERRVMEFATFPQPSSPMTWRRIAIVAAALSRVRWVPVDPDVLEAEKIVLSTVDPDCGFIRNLALEDLRKTDIMKATVAGIKRGRELAK